MSERRWLFGRSDEYVGIAYQPFAEALGHNVRVLSHRGTQTHVTTFGSIVIGWSPSSVDVCRRRHGRSGTDLDAERLLLRTSA